MENTIESRPMAASGWEKSQGKPWVVLIVEKALKQICPLAGASSGLAARMMTSGCVFDDMSPNPSVVFEEVYQAEEFDSVRAPWRRLRAGFLFTSTVPVDDVDQLPGILAELELELTLFVDD